MTLDSIIERLEKADCGSLELDCRIKQVIDPDTIFMTYGGDVRTKRKATYAPISTFEMKDTDDRGFWQALAAIWGTTPVTSSVDAAIALAEKVLPGWSMIVDTRPLNGGIRVKLFRPLEISNNDYGSFAASPAVALCLAILKAKQMGVGE